MDFFQLPLVLKSSHIGSFGFVLHAESSVVTSRGKYCGVIGMPRDIIDAFAQRVLEYRQEPRFPIPNEDTAICDIDQRKTQTKSLITCLRCH